MLCKAAHTEVQLANDVFKCPRCGGELSRDDVPADADATCQLIHVDDEYYCNECDYVADGAQAVNAALEKKYQSPTTPCPHCSGTGYVKPVIFGG